MKRSFATGSNSNFPSNKMVSPYSLPFSINIFRSSFAFDSFHGYDHTSFIRITTISDFNMGTNFNVLLPADQRHIDPICGAFEICVKVKAYKAEGAA